MTTFLRMIWERYEQCLIHRPYLTNAMTSSTIAIFGDCMAQTKFKDLSGVPRHTADDIPSRSRYFFVRRAPRRDRGEVQDTIVDLRRSMIFAGFTVCFGTPFWLRVYKFLDRVVPRATPWTAIKKGIVSWTIANSTTPIFIAYVTSMDRWFIQRMPPWQRTSGGDGSSSGDHGTLHAVFAKIRKDLPVMMSYSICFWSIQWIPMFYLLPSHVRLVYVSFLQIVWSGITSYLLHRSEPEDQIGGVPN